MNKLERLHLEWKKAKEKGDTEQANRLAHRIQRYQRKQNAGLSQVAKGEAPDARIEPDTTA